jgi:plastocyanin
MTIFSISTAISMTIAMTNMAIAQSNGGGNTTGTSVKSSSSAVQVQAGGGNSTLPFTVFSPQTAQIKTGQSIMWYNPSVAPEPHTVTFALDNNTRPELSATFAVKNSSNFMPIINFTSEPVIIPNHNNPSTTLI